MNKAELKVIKFEDDVIATSVLTELRTDKLYTFVGLDNTTVGDAYIIEVDTGKMTSLSDLKNNIIGKDAKVVTVDQNGTTRVPSLSAAITADNKGRMVSYKWDQKFGWYGSKFTISQ